MASKSPSADTAASPLLIGGLGTLLGVVLALGGVFLLAPAGSPDAGPGGPSAAGVGGGPEGPGPPPVDVVRAVETVAAEPVQLLGTARPVRRSAVAGEVDGVVVEVAVEEGDTVRQGEILVRLRSTTLREELDAATASLAEARARLIQAEADFERLADLLERDAISRSEYDRAVAERDALEQSVARAQADVDRLQELVKRSVIVAPYAGRVTEVGVELGEWVGRGENVVSLVDLSEVEVTIQVAERFVGAVEPGFPVSVTFDALPGERLAGRVTTLVPEAVPEARTFPVLVRVSNPDGRIKGGMAARVQAQLGSPRPAVLVHKDAVVRRDEQAFVFRLRPADQGSGGRRPGAGRGAPPEPDRAAGNGELSGGPGGPAADPVVGSLERIAVQTGSDRGAWVVVHGDVEPGDLIVVRGNERAFPGQPARVAEILEPEVPDADPDSPIAVDPRAREQSS